MNQKWFYSIEGKTHGPFSTAEIKSLALAGLLDCNSLIWPEESASIDVSEIFAVRDVKSLPSRAVPAPDWLADFQEDKGPRSIDWGEQGMPDWVAEFLNVAPGRSSTKTFSPPKPADERAQSSLEQTAKTEVSAIDLPATSPRQGECEMLLPWWQEGVTPRIEPTRLLLPPSTPKEIAAKQPTRQGECKTLSLLSQEAVAPSPIEPTTSPLPVSTPKEITSTQPVRPPVKGKTQLSARQVRNTVVRQMGFDPETGEIFDTDRYGKWKKHQQETNEPGDASFDVFHQGRRTIETWVDAEENKNLVVAGDLEAICSNEKLLEAMASFRACGPEMMEKLLSHLVFMVENRKRFHLAFSKQKR